MGDLKSIIKSIASRYIRKVVITIAGLRSRSISQTEEPNQITSANQSIYTFYFMQCLLNIKPLSVR